MRPDGIEPPTLEFEAQCSIQLSYGRIATVTDTTAWPGVPNNRERRCKWVRWISRRKAPGLFLLGAHAIVFGVVLELN